LQSPEARDAIQNNLNDAADESDEDDEDPVALTQEQAEHILSNLGQRFANVTLNVSEVPESPEPAGCVLTNKCVLGPKNCPKLRDRFVLVQSGIVDQKNELEEQLRQMENHCEEQQKSLTELVAGMEEKLRVERVNLATGTEDQNTAEAGSHTNAQQHESAVTEYIKTSKICCDNKNAMISELCALDRIRGELNNVNGTVVYMSDCEVSDWQKGECSVSCGGGIRQDTRNVIAHKTGNAVGCPPLSAASSCNTHKCPIDCRVDSWSEWSECSAECGGGVMERSRQETRKAAFDGEVCPSLEEEISCGAGACNKDCQLGGWERSWSTCSRACGKGSKRKLRQIEEPAKGTGFCPDPQSSKRLKFRNCNTKSCSTMLRDWNGASGKKKTLTCDAQIDLTIVMDGSGSLGWTGWTQSKRLVKEMVENLSPNVNVAVLLYSGPDEWAGVEKCIGDGPAVNMETFCRVKWISHYTQDFAGLATKVGALSWPKGGTLTSIALGMVDADLMYGRAGAASKVLVITDGKPLSSFNTKAASNKLQTSADVIWVPIGESAPMKEIKEMASKPARDHIIKIVNFNNLKRRFTYWLNRIISTTCPEIVEDPSRRMEIGGGPPPPGGQTFS